MGNGCFVADDANCKSCALKTSDSRFASCAGSIEVDFTFFHSYRHRLFSGILRRNSRCKCRGFFRTSKIGLSSRRPCNHIASQIGDRNSGVVECRLYMGYSSWYCALNFLFNSDRSFLRRCFLFLLSQGSSPLIRFSCWQQFCVCLYAYGHSFGFFDLVQAGRYDGACRDNNESQSDA